MRLSPQQCVCMHMHSLLILSLYCSQLQFLDVLGLSPVFSKWNMFSWMQIVWQTLPVKNLKQIIGCFDCKIRVPSACITGKVLWYLHSKLPLKYISSQKKAMTVMQHSMLTQNVMLRVRGEIVKLTCKKTRLLLILIRTWGSDVLQCT